MWPDQAERVARLRGALDIAARVPVGDRAPPTPASGSSSGSREPAAGVATMVVHSIVLQYLPRASLHRMRDALRAAGAHATPDATVHWLRMEPAGQVADLRLTSWTGSPDDGTDEVLATAGYHGTPVSVGRG